MRRGINQPNPNSPDGRAAERRFFRDMDEELAREEAYRQEVAYKQAVRNGWGFTCGDCHRRLQSDEVAFDKAAGHCFHYDSRTGTRHDDVYPQGPESEDWE